MDIIGSFLYCGTRGRRVVHLCIQSLRFASVYFCETCACAAALECSCVLITIRLYPECGSDQGKQCGVEHYCSIAV